MKSVLKKAQKWDCDGKSSYLHSHFVKQEATQGSVTVCFSTSWMLAPGGLHNRILAQEEELQLKVITGSGEIEEKVH